MKKLMILATLAAVAVPGRLAAHEGHAHKMMGTVTAVHADMKHIEIKIMTGKTSGFYVDDGTKYMMGSKSVSPSEIKVGSRVVVTATGSGEKMTASLMRVSDGGAVSKKGTASKKPATHEH
jgi:hypothetical protein